ncbi:ArnT family glycosyltransferase [Candidatus Methylomirabilis sp.]|jgi:4-amino-4-deoxy-L-arabinose transferase-like glycosyltransferase|uniref:ArnT family glycosyltransferase n=1 Tax=Candidatus Methylomirabilis sp. TaxID=2032687 RepID=UPI003C728A6F
MKTFSVNDRGARWDRRLLWILGVGAIVRLILLYVLGDLDLWMDEEQYQEIAVNLVEGRGFALQGQPTSWRPPLYPFLLSGLYMLAGTTHPIVARAFQAILSLVNGLMVYMLGRRLFGERVGLGAALLFTVYPSFLFYNNHLLTEVLFTFLLTVTAYCFAAYLENGRLPFLAASGVALGLAVLTRDIVWPMVGIMTLLIGYVTRQDFIRRTWHSAVLLMSFLVITMPWVIRNTRLQDTVTLIATNGGIVFLEGNYEYTPLDRPWRSHALDPELKVRRLLPTGLTEGQRQRIAFQRGLEFIRTHPGLTLRRAVIKAANVWGLERELVGVLLKGGYGKPGKGVVLLVTAAIFGVYALSILGGMTGLCFAVARPGQGMSFHLFFAALVVLLTVAHALAFGHPRYHLPLMPLFSVYAAYAWTIRREFWNGRRSWAFKAASLAAGLLLAIWIREVFSVEFERFVAGLGGRL